jgi:hypothetical protein
MVAGFELLAIARYSPVACLGTQRGGTTSYNAAPTIFRGFLKMDDFLLDVQSDNLARDRRAADTARNATRVDATLDAFFERLEVEVGATRTPPLFKSQIAEIVGLDEDDLDQPQKPSLKAALSRASSLTELSQFAKSHGSDVEKAFGVLRKRYEHCSTLTESLRSAADLFSEHFTDDEANLLDKAIVALDLPLFLQVLARAVGRSA